MQKNTVKQKQLDEAKWIASELAHEDMSGAMYYCDACDRQRNGYVCGATQEERVAYSLCAKAHNRMGRKKKNDLHK